PRSRIHTEADTDDDSPGPIVPLTVQEVSQRVAITSRAGWTRRTLFAVIGTVTIVPAILAGIYFVKHRQTRGVQPPARATSLAILPFRNLKPEPETDFLGPS